MEPTASSDVDIERLWFLNHMPSKLKRTSEYIATLSSLIFRSPGDDGRKPAEVTAVYPDVQFVSELNEHERLDLLSLANSHHVTVRALQALDQSAAMLLGRDQIRSWCQKRVDIERSRIINAVENLVPICNALEAAGAPVVVIKSLDHWPDLGSDLDLYTTGNEQ